MQSSDDDDGMGVRSAGSSSPSAGGARDEVQSSRATRYHRAHSDSSMRDIMRAADAARSYHGESPAFLVAQRSRETRETLRLLRIQARAAARSPQAVKGPSAIAVEAVARYIKEPVPDDFYDDDDDDGRNTNTNIVSEPQVIPMVCSPQAAPISSTPDEVAVATGMASLAMNQNGISSANKHEQLVSEVFGGVDVSSIGKKLVTALWAHATHQCRPGSRCAARAASNEEMRKLKVLTKKSSSTKVDTLVREIVLCRTAISQL